MPIHLCLPATNQSPLKKWFLFPYISRRTLFLIGIFINTLICFIIGGLGVPPSKHSFSWTIASLVVNGFHHYVSMIPTIFTLSVEAPPHCSSKSVPIGRGVYTCCNIAASLATTDNVERPVKIKNLRPYHPKIAS
ncbi:hypothetical protein BDV06DRAFT_227458 [Aspergillus oleicola]